jgi:hypothetical protein
VLIRRASAGLVAPRRRFELAWRVWVGEEQAEQATGAGSVPRHTIPLLIKLLVNSSSPRKRHFCKRELLKSHPPLLLQVVIFALRHTAGSATLHKSTWCGGFTLLLLQWCAHCIGECTLAPVVAVAWNGPQPLPPQRAAPKAHQRAHPAIPKVDGKETPLATARLRRRAGQHAGKGRRQRLLRQRM